MSAIVYVERGDLVLTDTQIVAKEFGMKHHEVMRRVSSVLSDYPQFRAVSNLPKNDSIPEFVRVESRNYKGKDFDAAVMNRDFFALLMFRFETERARQKQLLFVRQFFAMEEALLKERNNQANLEWTTARQQSKVTRREETDIIQRFTDYATAQGSESAKFYYKHITMACYKCLQLVESKKPKVRDTLNLMELNQLVLAEVVAGRSLMRHMDAGEHYKVIYELVKQDLEKFADGLMLPRQMRLSA